MLASKLSSSFSLPFALLDPLPHAQIASDKKGKLISPFQEILEIVDNTLEKRVKQKPPGEQSQVADKDPASHKQLDHEDLPPAELGADTADHTATDEIPAVQTVPVNPQEVQETTNAIGVTYENGFDATTTDYSLLAETSKPDNQSADKPARRMTR